MKEIPLSSKKYPGLFAIVDDEDYPSLNRKKWYAEKHRGTFYASREEFGRLVRMHNRILGIKGVDHKNRKGLDNQRENLRPATNAENHWNSPGRKWKKFKGVCKISKNRWMSRIKVNGKAIYIGCYKTEEEAAKHYDIKANEFHGKFAWLNFREGME